MNSKYQLGWFGLRLQVAGKSSRFLKRAGWIKLGPAEPNNRNGWNWIRPGVLKENNRQDWRPLAATGAVGIVVWFADAQWGSNEGITNQQWQARAIVEQDFNAKWPTGIRA